MKNKNHIILGILAIYILFLPIVLVFHTQTHLQDITIINNSIPANVNFEDNLDCPICLFYFNQQLYIQSISVLILKSISGYFHQNIAEIHITITQEQQYLRGPPLLRPLYFMC